MRYIKSKADKAWKDPDHTRVILDSGFPFTSAEHSMVNILGAKTKIKFSLYAAGLQDDCSYSEFVDHLKERKLGYQHELDATLDKIDYSND